MRKINREDMLELTRRMTVKRNCFDRIAGAYLDEEGYVDATFNRHFLKLKLNEQAENLAIAKEIPFADTNKNLREYAFPEDAQKPGSIWQLLMALKSCELKNDALLDVFYEKVGGAYKSKGPYAVYFSSWKLRRSTKRNGQRKPVGVRRGLSVSDLRHLSRPWRL